MPNEAFEELMREQNPKGYLARADNGEYIVPGIQKKWEGYQLRQPEIDALKAQIASDDRLLKIRGEGLNKTYAENTNLRAEIDALKADNQGLSLAVSLLQAEVERLRADAERYRWLRDPCVDIRPIVKYQRGDYGWGLLTHQSLDEVIDAAIKETK